jgi:hypothetical protein
MAMTYTVKNRPGFWTMIDEGPWCLMRDPDGNECKARKGWLTPVNDEGTAGSASGSSMNLLAQYRGQYQKVNNASGRVSRHCGDRVANTLARLTPDQVVNLASELLGEDLATKYAHLNPGQRRMNAGNAIRQGLKNGAITEAGLAEAAAVDT